MYSFKSRVRYSETDTDARLSLIGIMNYFQDCCTFHSEDSGVGLSYLERKKKAWLLSSWQIFVIRRPSLGEEIVVSTWPYSFNGIYGLRNFVINDREGEFLVKANSCWFLVSTETMRPIRVTQDETAPYGDIEPPLEMDYAPRKIELPDRMTEAGRVKVMKHQIDTNRHVNNAQYVDMARDILPEGQEISMIRAEYRKAAVLGDELILRKAETEEGYIISLCGQNGTVFANVELRR